MAGRLIGKGSASSRTVASPWARRRTIERRVGSDNAANTTSNLSGAVTGIVAASWTSTSQICYLTEVLNLVKHHIGRVRSGSGSCCHPRGAPTTGSEAFDELVDEANEAPVDTWDFGWLDGRATEERPSWRYFDRVAERAGAASSLLELQ